MPIVPSPLNTYARHDRAHCLFSGLFRLCPHREREELHIRAAFGDEVLHAFGPSLLGVEEMRALQGLTTLAGRSAPGRYGKVLPAGAMHNPLRHRLYLDGAAQTQDAIIVTTSFCRLARETGYKASGGTTIRCLRKSIERLSQTVLVRETSTGHGSSHLLSFFEEDTKDGSLHVALNPSIAASIAGRSQFVYIDMREVRALQTDAGRLLHQRLSAVVTLGRTRALTTSTLLGYLWPGIDCDALSRDERYRRRRRLRKALADIASLSSWSLIEAEENRLWRLARKNTRDESFKATFAKEAAAH